MDSGGWFAKLFGFVEADVQTVKENLVCDGTQIISRVNWRRFAVGEFSTPSLGELRARVQKLPRNSQKQIEILYIAVDDIYETHKDSRFAGAMFQVASQFNCLEFVSANVTPEDGVTSYACDNTQGPACSLACPIATVYRNYFATTPKNNTGQSEFDQINNLDALEDMVDNSTNHYWTIKNGYTNSTPEQLKTFTEICETGKWDREALLATVKIGLHLNVEVLSTFEDQQVIQVVNQAFCSGISISYSNPGTDDWEILARIILDASYESTLLAAILASTNNTGSKKIILTFIGGGVFANPIDWIINSIARACAILYFYNIKVYIAFYKTIDENIVNQINSEYKRICVMLYGD